MTTPTSKQHQFAREVVLGKSQADFPCSASLGIAEHPSPGTAGTNPQVQATPIGIKPGSEACNLPCRQSIDLSGHPSFPADPHLIPVLLPVLLADLDSAGYPGTSLHKDPIYVIDYNREIWTSVDCFGC